MKKTKSQTSEWCPLCGQTHGEEGTPGYSCYRPAVAEIKTNLPLVGPEHPDYEGEAVAMVSDTP